MGPVFLNCECGGRYVWHSVLFQNQDLLYNVHPVLFAYEANKPCQLPNNLEEFYRMWNDQEGAPRPTHSGLGSFPTHSIGTPEWMTFTLENRQNMRTDISRTHEMVYANNLNNYDDRQFVIIRKIE